MRSDYYDRAAFLRAEEQYLTPPEDRTALQANYRIKAVMNIERSTDNDQEPE